MWKTILLRCYQFFFRSQKDIFENSKQYTHTFVFHLLSSWPKLDSKWKNAACYKRSKPKGWYITVRDDVGVGPPELLVRYLTVLRWARLHRSCECDFGWVAWRRIDFAYQQKILMRRKSRKTLTITVFYGFCCSSSIAVRNTSVFHFLLLLQFGRSIMLEIIEVVWNFPRSFGLHSWRSSQVAYPRTY